MNVKTASTLGIGVAFIAIAGVALWTLTISDTPTVSAERAMQVACGQLDKEDSYDIVASVKGEQDGVA